MKRIFVGVFCGFCVIGPACSSTWTAMPAANDGTKIYAETSSMKVRAGEARVWTLIDYPTQQVDNSIGVFSSIRQQFLVSCKMRQVALLQMEAFSGPTMTGASVHRDAYPDAIARTYLRDPAPDTMTHDLVEAVCK